MTMIQHESEYLRWLEQRGVGANDHVASSPKSYVSYLNSVSRALGIDISPSILSSEADVTRIVEDIKGKRARNTIQKYKSAMHQYVAMVQARDRKIQKYNPLPPPFLMADDIGVRLEEVNGLAIWEAQPLYKHQKAVERIAQSIRSANLGDCQCVHAMDVYIQFPNGLKRPDISIFCREPSEEEQENALTLIPEAVIEVVSKGYEAKDLEIGPPFYLSQGVKDVIVYDPSTLLVLHVRQGRAERAVAPLEIALQCGCQVAIGG